MAERCPLSHGDGPCEVLSQSCCETREKPPETVSKHSEAPPEATGPCSRGPSGEGQGCRTDQRLTRSHSDSVSALELKPAVDSCPLAPDSCTLTPASCTVAPDSCTPAPASCASAVGSCTLMDSCAGGPVLVCKRSMQLQQCNMVTTVCRGALGSDGPIPQMCHGPLGAQGPQTADTEEPSCDRSLCYGSHLHHTNLEDTFAAYCHPQPIPAPSQLLPPLIGPEGPSHLSVPRLMASASETGLDNKHVSCCCQLGCSWVSVLPPCPARAPTRDVGTLTVRGALKDVGVQTDDSGTHVFPQVCLSEEPHRGPKDSVQKAGSKSPVKEVKWDAEGMTWEVYGASVDPEELGLAIQKHLELQIRETASRAAKLSRQNTNTSRHSGGSCQRKRRVLRSLRPPVCCARTTTAVD